MTKESNLWGA